MVNGCVSDSCRRAIAWSTLSLHSILLFKRIVFKCFLSFLLTSNHPPISAALSAIWYPASNGELSFIFPQYYDNQRRPRSRCINNDCLFICFFIFQTRIPFYEYLRNWIAFNVFSYVFFLCVAFYCLHWKTIFSSSWANKEFSFLLLYQYNFL